MSPRPAIFISAVSCELKSARQLVANTLTFLGYGPEWQDIFGTEEGDLRAMLRRRIDASKGVVQLVGNCYGAEPPTTDEQFGRVSYSQYEALYAKNKGKKVWYLFLDDTFPTDPHQEEGEEKQRLQSGYRARVKADNELYHPLSNREGLEASVLKLRDELTRLRRGVKRWAAFVAGLLVLIVALTVWLLQSQQRSNEQLQAVQEELEKLQQGVTSFAEVQNKVRQEQPGQKPEEVEERTYEELSKELGLDAATLKKQLPLFAEELKKSPHATTYERANAAYVAKDYNEAERLALAAGDEARTASPPKNTEAIKALELAGWAAEKRVEYAEALQRLRDAERLTDRTRDAEEWARVQFAIATVLDDQGQYQDSELVLCEVLNVRQGELGPEHPDTLVTRRHLAVVLHDQGKYPQAETEFRTIIRLSEKVLGPEDPETLSVRSSLAATLTDEGKYAEAETEDRAVVKLTEKVLGPKHRDTLRAHYNLAGLLDYQGKYVEAEAEHREIIKLTENVLGPEHPDTLRTRTSLAVTLANEGKYAEAEAEYRAVFSLEEKVLGPEHPDTLLTRSDLATIPFYQGKYPEAEIEYRAVIRLQEKVLGPEHPDTLTTRNNLAYVLNRQDKYTEAETECRAVIELEKKSLGFEHPLTLSTRSCLAEVLDHQGRYVEAEAECQAVLAASEKVLGSEHAGTLDTRNCLAKVFADEGKYAASETEFRAVLTLREKVLGAEHPDTLDTCFNLAVCLRSEGKFREASAFAQRAAEGASKFLGPEHPDSKKYEKLLKELQSTGGSEASVKGDK